MFRYLLLLLVLLAPTSFADDLYQVELIVFQQEGDAVYASQPAPEDWAKGAQPPAADSRRPTAMDAQANKLAQAQGYQVLMHKAWKQAIGDTPVKIAISEGRQQDGHFPVEGTLTLRQQRFIDTQADFWVNQFGGDGLLQHSQHMVQDVSLKNDVLAYLDHPSLGMLIRISPLNAKPTAAPPAEMQEEAPAAQPQQPAAEAPANGGFDAPPASEPGQQ
ncbi:CsiV family protein [Pseudomonas citronellolis]|uniref:CsiV family protein n=1 Tax=Pseudomonas citronellolis TaxID=53408 RepID=UPI0023E41C19|nr:CsiV family protein [Pseudomonas citronellolis]MDF3931004.1 CsiV family protein [Pseudomonas citronellolis]